jgi:hypothetical protein
VVVGGGIADLAREAGARLNTSATVTAMTTLPDKAGWMRAAVMGVRGLPMCLISAELVVKRLRGDRSSNPLGASV